MGWFNKNIAPMPPSDWKKKAGLIKWDGEQEKKKVQKKVAKTEKVEKKPLKRTPVRKVGKKKTTRIKEWGSEVALFHAIWQSRADKAGLNWCEVCGCVIDSPKTWSFAHRLSKGRYPEYRLYEKNIALVCSIDCHHELDRQNVGRDQEIIKFLSNGK